MRKKNKKNTKVSMAQPFPRNYMTERHLHSKRRYMVIFSICSGRNENAIKQNAHLNVCIHHRSIFIAEVTYE